MKYKILKTIAMWLVSAGWWLYRKAINCVVMPPPLSGIDLDKVGLEYCGILRDEGESDKDYKIRIMSFLQGPGGGTGI